MADGVLINHFKINIMAIIPIILFLAAGFFGYKYYTSKGESVAYRFYAIALGVAAVVVTIWQILER